MVFSKSVLNQKVYKILVKISYRYNGDMKSFNIFFFSMKFLNQDIKTKIKSQISEKLGRVVSNLCKN